MLINDRQKFILALLSKITDSENPVKTSTIAGYVSSGFYKNTRMTKIAYTGTLNDLNKLRKFDMVSGGYREEDGKVSWCITTHGKSYIQEKSKFRWIKAGLEYGATLAGIAGGVRNASGY